MKRNKKTDSTGEIEATNDPHKFVFELDRAIRDQVLARINQSPMMPLVKNGAPAESGIYALYWKGTLVYIGKASREKTKSKRTLRGRLNEHVGKIAGRQNIKISEMTCRYLTIESDWFVWAAEFALIEQLKPEWNGSGFGSKTPGKGRPGTDRKSPWDQEFPPEHLT